MLFSNRGINSQNWHTFAMDCTLAWPAKPEMQVIVRKNSGGQNLFELVGKKRYVLTSTIPNWVSLGSLASGFGLAAWGSTALKRRWDRPSFCHRARSFIHNHYRSLTLGLYNELHSVDDPCVLCTSILACRLVYLKNTKALAHRCSVSRSFILPWWQPPCLPPWSISQWLGLLPGELFPYNDQSRCCLVRANRAGRFDARAALRARWKRPSLKFINLEFKIRLFR